MQDRVLNFLNNWIDANISHTSQELDDDAASMQHRFLTASVASGLSLEEVNEQWFQVDFDIRKAINKLRASGGATGGDVSE